MPLATADLLRLTKHSANIRNICILAHVDHGKTTLSDSLLASNGVISSKSAGQVRYLDSREDEQERGITMKASAIALYFKLITNSMAKSSPQNEEQIVESTEKEYLIHLIDSPGHIDFTSEVSVASRLCDGALVLVDVIEGICTQTHIVLKQAWTENVKPVLVLNKIDRLIVELKLTTVEAYQHLLKIVEQANVVMHTFRTEHGALSDGDTSKSQLHTIDSLLSSRDAPFFDPVNGSVIFASAVDGWAFRLVDFVALYASKLNVSDGELLKGLWGNYTYSSKESKIVMRKESNIHAKNMFSQLILDNIWSVYDSCQMNYNLEKIEKISNSLKIKLNPFEIRSKDTKSVTKAVMSQWLPLSRTVLLSVINNLPNPLSAQKLKFENLQITFPDNQPLSDCSRCCTESANTTAFIAKMVSTPILNLSDFKEIIQEAQAIDESLTEDAVKNQEILLGFGRVFSGTLKRGQTIYVLSPRYDPKTPELNVSEIVVKGLYLIMGRNYESVDYASAGNVFAIRGVENQILKWATLSSTKTCPSLGYSSHVDASNSIVRVALEPKDPTKMPNLIEGLRLLNQADPAVEVLVQERGEHVLLTSGELHLERCIRDLKERFAKIEIQTSAPIVPFRETISDKLYKHDDSTVEISTSSKLAALRIRCQPMPIELISFLEKDAALIRDSLDNAEYQQKLIAKLKNIDPQLRWDQLVAFGPKRTGSNLLFSFADAEMFKMLENGILSGFQLATASGPMCGEPLLGCIFIIETINVDTGALSADDSLKTALSGQIIRCMKDGCKEALLKWSPRLMLAMYSCDIQATSEVLGKVYAVLSKRHGKILSEEMKEGTDMFTIKAHLPVVESFGFSDDIRKKTSGAAQPQLAFDKWEVLDEDPFWVPTTEEELEDLGEKADRVLLAKKYMDAVRKRKGLFVEEKLVEHAEKQRTLKIK